MPEEEVLKPIISVVFPVYNAERFLRESIESILNQSFDNFELIIINDGSVDSTSEILNSFSDNRIRLIERENRGFAASVNEGVSVSNAKYIARMDADDVSLPDRLRLQYDYMESHPDVGILGGQAWRIDENGRLIGEITKPISTEHISQYIKYVCPVTHPTYCVRKHVYGTLHGYREFLAPAGDYDFLLRAYEHGVKIENLSVKLIKYRLNLHGMSSGNTLRGMVFSRYVQKMHKCRIKDREKDEQIIAFLKAYEKTPSHWFSFFCRFRDHFLRRSKNKNGLIKHICLSMVFLASIMHYELFLSSLMAYRSLKWIDKSET